MSNPLLDYYVRRRIFQNRWAVSEAEEIIKLLEKLNQDIVDLALKEIDPDRIDLLDVLMSQSEALHKQLNAELTDKTERKLREFVNNEVDSQSELFKGLGIVFEELNPSAVFAAAHGEPFRGRELGEWYRSLTERQQQRINDTIKIGYLDGQPKEVIIDYLMQVFPGTYKDAEAIMRTATIHYSSVAQEEIMRAANIDRYIWVSTLDGRTTPICQTRDGQVFKLEKNSPMPPAHVGCRSVASPIAPGLEPIKRQTYNDWIKKQPAPVQDDILGPARAELLRQGVSVDKFVSDAGRTLTLEELSQRERDAWKAAGL